jgi:hypothetical protein
MTNQLATQSQADVIEQVVINGDLSALTAPQRVQYYQQVCKSIGLNPLTKPFDYIQLNGRLTLYARKDAADQLRKIYGVSIDDVDITENEKQFIVKVKGHDVTGRFDVEFGVVNKTDMRGDLSNAMMKAVTKAKRRLTLSICGLGWLDETEVETIPTAKPVTVDAETGEIVQDIQPIEQMLVDQGVVENVHHAKAVIKALDCVNLSVEESIARVRCYRGWRDLGMSKTDAAAKAIMGEVPA